MDNISVRKSKNAIPGLIKLTDFIHNLKPDIVSIIELGSYVGDSTRVWAEKFNEVIAVDPWKNGYDENDASSYTHPMSVVEAQFDKLCDTYSNIVKWKMTSEKACQKFDDDSIQFVYIDALHTYEGVKKDIELWYPKVMNGYFIAGHDYGSRHHPGVKKAVDELLGKPDAVFPDSSWIKLKGDIHG